MLGLGTGEMVVIAVVALLVIGPDRLPRMARQMGKYYGQVRRMADDLRRAFVMEADRQDAQERYSALQARRKTELEQRAAKVEAPSAAEAAPERVGPTLVEAPTEGVDSHHAEPDAGPSGPVPNDIPPDAPHPDLLRSTT
jgi:sec-independent protein translocase protein TatB